MRKITFIFILFFNFLGLFAQQKEWMSMMDCGYLVNVRSMDTDQKGNVYVGGNYQGEAFFRSATGFDNHYNLFTSEHWKESFVVKYSSKGDIQYIITLKSSGGNSGSSGSEPFELKCLKNGDFAIQIYGGSTFNLKTPVDTLKIRCAQKGSILRFTEEGKFLWKCDIGATDYKPVIEDEDGNLYTFLKPDYTHNALMVKITPEGQVEKRIDRAGENRSYNSGIGLVEKVGDKIWYVHGKHIKDGDYYFKSRDIMEFFTFDLKTEEIEKCFEMEIPYGTDADYTIGMVNDKPQIVAWISSRAKTFQYQNEEYNMEEQQLMLRLDEKGDVKHQAYVPVLYRYNRTMLLEEDGSMLICAPASDTLTWNDKVVRTERKHTNQFIHELYLIKLDKRFNPVWMVTAGGTASNYHYSKVLKNGNRIILASDLLDYGNIMNEFVGLNWKSGFYVLQVKDL